MKIVQINSTCGIGSTGKICTGISQLLTENGIENYILYSSKGDDYPLGIRCSDDFYIKLQALKSRIFGNYGFNSKKATRRMIAELERIKPDIVHLHNIHGHDCDLEMLFTYFKEHGIKLLWTFHDCWAFTGYCTYFDLVKCNAWNNECKECPQKNTYTWLLDRSQILFNQKRKLFNGLNLNIIAPSMWMVNMVKHSFLKDYPVLVINNGIDPSIFKAGESGFKDKHQLNKRKLILGVSFEWENRKGMDVFIELSKRLPKDYKIILVGTDDNVDRKLPSNILSIHRTQNQRELAEIYSAADVFVNPTREENYPTVNMEAIACGIPVLTFRTGGSPEMLDETCGSVVDCDDIDALEKEIIRICETKPYSREACLRKAIEFNKNERYKEYVELYERIYATGAN